MIKCKFCGKTFESYGDFILHIKRECKYVPKTRRCPICGMKFRSIRLCKLHMVNAALQDVNHRNYIITTS